MTTTNQGPIPCETCGGPRHYSEAKKRHKRCDSCYKKNWYRENKKRVRAVNRAYYENHRPEHAQQTRNWRTRNPERAAAIGWKKNLRDTCSSVEYYERKFQEQSGRCAICGRPGLRRRLCQDHDAKRKKPRGLLCNPCNFLVGVIETRGLEVVEKAKVYLSDFSEGETNASH